MSDLSEWLEVGGVSETEPTILVGNIVDDVDLPYRVVCDHCGAVVGHARIVDQVGGVYQYEWRHEDPDHRCALP